MARVIDFLGRILGGEFSAILSSVTTSVTRICSRFCPRWLRVDVVESLEEVCEDYLILFSSVLIE